MRKIQILGPGCPKCNKLEKNVRDVVNMLDTEYEVEKVSDIQQIMNYGILMTPGLVINGKIVSSGRVLKQQEIQNLISASEGE